MVLAVPVGVCLSRRRLCRGGRADACGCSYLGPGKGRPQAHGVWGAGGGWLTFWQGALAQRGSAFTVHIWAALRAEPLPWASGFQTLR